MKNSGLIVYPPRVKSNLRKSVRVVSLALCFLLIFSLPAFTNPISPNKALVTLEKQDVTLESVLREIENQTSYLFVSNSKDVNLKQIVSISAKKEPILNVLDDLLSDTDITYKIEGVNIVLSKNKQIAKTVTQDDDRNINGTVSDDEGERIVGANILEKGTLNGCNTDSDGRFNLRVKEGATIVVSFMGFKTYEFQVTRNSSYNIVLNPDKNLLDEVVVIGYGTVKKSDLTGSVSSVKSKELTAIPSGTLLTALQGRSSGLQVKQNSGAPGGFISVRIRGANSIQGSNEPLYVIDGFPSSGSNPTLLNNNDIESIEILKDASAVAIYGSRGANGVVMITTKKGKAGTSRINVGTTVGFQKIRKKMEMMTAKQYALFYNQQRINDGLGAYFTDEQINSFGKGYDWQGFVFRTAPIRTHTFDISGGTDKTQFFVSGNVYNQKGILKGGAFKKYSVRANINHNFNEHFTFEFSANLSRNILNDKNWGGARFGASLIGSALCTPPTLTPYNDDGSVRVLNTEYPFLSEGLINPIHYIEDQTAKTKTNNALINAAFTYKPFKDLFIKVSGGIENIDSRYDYYRSLEFPHSVGSASVSTSQHRSLLNEDTINYIKTFNKVHSLSILGGVTFQEFYDTSLSGSGSGFLSDVTYTGNLSAASTPGIPSSSYTKSTLLSYLGRVNYSYDNRYLFTASFRADGASKYSSGNKWGYFPSFALAWKAKNENFLKDNPTISDLKIRTSWGETGSQAIGAYATMNNLYSGKTVFGDALYTTFAPSTRLPGNLKWETTAQYDIGVDLGLMDNKYTFTIDYYIKRTRDLLNSVQLPSSMGYTTTLKNVGKIENKGLEFSASANIISSNTWNWRVDGNISFNRSKVVKLYGGDDIYGGWQDMMIISDNVNLLREGEAVGVFYGYKKNGYDENGAEVYVDQNKDGIINQEDKTIIGDPNADFIYGLNSILTWKDFEFTLFIEGSHGNDIVNISSVDNTLDYGYGCNMFKKVWGNNWTPENPNAKYPKITRNQVMRFSDRLVEDGSYLRFKNIELAYNVPVAKLNMNRIRSIRLFVSAQNLLTITDYSGWDPEVNSLGGANSFAQGIDHYSYPTAKSITFGINFGF